MSSRHRYADGGPGASPDRHSASGLYLLALLIGIVIGIVVFIATGQPTRSAPQPTISHSLGHGAAATCVGGATRCSRQ